MGKWITAERLNIILAVLTLLLAALTLFLAWVTYKLSGRTLSYMRERDLELDTRNGWIEIHKAMLAVRAYGTMVMFPAIPGAYSSAISPSDVAEKFTVARQQLIGQLARLNDDPLLVEISEFLLSNLLTKDWQTTAFEDKFDAFAKQVAMKARPK